MHDIDFERAAMLMDVQSKCANTGVMMSYIAGEAGEELKAINEACRENAFERANERAAEEANRVQPERPRLQAAEPTEEVEDDEVVDEDDDLGTTEPIQRRR